jgi:hypothetical protein
MNPQAVTAAGNCQRQVLPPDEYMRYVEAAKREAKCRACGAPIPKGKKHLCFHYQDDAWRRRFRLCNLCLSKIIREATKKEGKRARANGTARPYAREGKPSLINIALPGREFFDSLRSNIPAQQETKETACSERGGRDFASDKEVTA